jgi:cytochrome c-type biogenesis protein CcmH/NrfG
LGYRLIRSKKVEQAIRIFQLNVEAYPQSSNVYDSLAEAYMNHGDKQQALANYQRALQLNPKNKTAARMIQELTKGALQ